MNTLIKKIRILRHRTAIDRKSLSTPFQTLNRYNYLDGRFTVLDYGCGKGDDVRILRENNIDAIGWDPVYHKDNRLQKRDIVNLGFVINVIEDLKERANTLKKAYNLANVLLVVSAMLGSEAIISRYKPLGDGILTERNTFQKYYTQRELKDYLEAVLGESAIAVGPGIFFVFKDKIKEQEFLINREKTIFNWTRLSSSIHPDRLLIRQKAIYETHKELLDRFWITCLNLGRIPASDEYEDSESIKRFVGSHKKAFDIVINLHDKSDFEQAQRQRIEDLTVYFALEHFSKRKAYLHLADSLKRDIKAFFSTYKDALEHGRQVLFSVGKPEVIYDACRKWYEQNRVGFYKEGHSLTIHKSYMQQIPATLRVYVGCARVLYGNLDDIDLIKIHIRSGKVSLMQYDDFENKQVPLLIKRIKIRLRDQEIEFYEYGGQYPPPPLENKELFKPIP